LLIVQHALDLIEHSLSLLEHRIFLGQLVDLLLKVCAFLVVALSAGVAQTAAQLTHLLTMLAQLGSLLALGKGVPHLLLMTVNNPLDLLALVGLESKFSRQAIDHHIAARTHSRTIGPFRRVRRGFRLTLLRKAREYQQKRRHHRQPNMSVKHRPLSFRAPTAGSVET
jgi:hypothetical protein